MVFLPHYPKILSGNYGADSTQKLKSILSKLGDPHKKMPPIIHVVGTNGKGSVCNFLYSIFKASNYKTHLYTSPHIHQCNERIKIDGQEISDDYLFELIEEIRMVDDQKNLTLFETLTLAAILAFSKNMADICIIEAGMGAKYDATNIIENKIASIITAISYDHTEYLGQSIKLISTHKAFTMQPNIPCINANFDPEIKFLLEGFARNINCPIFSFKKDFDLEENHESKTFDLTFGNQKFTNLPKPSLEGLHQYQNASLAIVTTQILKQFQIDQKAISLGIRNTIWKNRLEKIHNYPLINKNNELWIDGAHNEGGFIAISDWFKEKCVDDYFDDLPKRNYIIVGTTKGKANFNLFYPFNFVADFMCAIRVEGEPNPENATEIISFAKSAGFETCLDMPDLESAITFLQKIDPENPCRIVIMGSLYLGRDLKKLIKQA